MRMPNTRPRTAALAAAALVLALVASCAAADTAARAGRVLDALSGAPVPGAAVRLTCKLTVWGIGHATSMDIKTVTASTGPDGQFQFSAIDVLMCPRVEIAVSKPAYVGVPAQAAPPDPALPTYYLVRESERVSVELRRLSSYTAGHLFHLDGSYARLDDYAGFALQFLEAKLIARSEAQQRYVRDAFCVRLLALYDTLSEDEKRQMEGRAFTGAILDRQLQTHYAHEREVGAFCSGG